MTSWRWCSRRLRPRRSRSRQKGNRRMRRWGLAVAVLIFFAAPAAAHAAITISTSSNEIQYRQEVTISGAVEGIAPPTLPPNVELKAKPYGAKRYTHVASGQTD